LGISKITARNQLKTIFSKTDTHRQSELVALLARL
jgi:DNA-binding CsgD family transcriptional regulator